MVNLRILVLVFSLILFGCEKVEEVPKEPQKPASVPNESIWVGGIDGGVFISIKKENKSDPNAYSGEVYYVSGDLAYKGLFRLHPKDSGGFEENDPKSYQGWDGDTIFLTNDRQLRVEE